METEFKHIVATDIQMEEHAKNVGSMMLCQGGCAELQINFDKWHLTRDSLIIFFPDDIVLWLSVSDDFSAEVLRYSREILRAASMNIEHEIYQELRRERIFSHEPITRNIIGCMFQIFRFNYNDPYLQSIDRITTLQVHSFFMGFADYLRYNPNILHSQTNDTQRNQQLFASFMRLLEEHYTEHCEVAFYASEMNISRKYLGHIVRNHTGLTAKHLIDDYRMQRLMLALTTTTRSVKEIANDYHFTDQSAFTRYFKAHTGKSPKEYKSPST